MYQPNVADALTVLTHAAFLACVNSRTDYYPIVNSTFSASGCIDAPMWMPTGSCGQWTHAPSYSGILIVNREGA